MITLNHGKSKSITTEQAMIVVLEWLLDGLNMLDPESIEEMAEDEIGEDATDEEQAAAYALIWDAFNGIEKEIRQKLAALRPETETEPS